MLIVTKPICLLPANHELFCQNRYEAQLLLPSICTMRVEEYLATMTAFRVTSLGPANNATAPQLGEKERQRPPPPSLVGWLVRSRATSSPPAK